MMSEQQTPIHDQYDGGVAPPPRILLWLIVGLFLFFVIVGTAAFLIYRSEQRLIALMPLAFIIVIGLALGSVIFAVAFRKSLPARLWLWLLIGLFGLAIMSILGGVLGFQSLLRPEYQQVVVTQMPFMRAFLPPTPAGGILPTSAPLENGDISPEDLLAAPLTLATSTPEHTEEAAIRVEPSVTVTPTATTTTTPTPTPTTETSSTDTAVVAPTEQINEVQVSRPSHPASARLFGFTHTKQTWNNCGPANITMALSYYGWNDDQSAAASFLKPDKEDKNVNPGEMVAFVNERTQVRAITRIGGSLELLKEFVAAEFPVIIETGYMPEGYDWIGHYQTVVGYDDLIQVFYIYDSYLGTGENATGLAENYEDLDKNWQDFNRTFIVIYPPERESEVARILGDRANLITAAENALQVAQDEARANPQDPFAWFNIGTALTKLERYDEAAVAYDQSRRVGVLPWRITWYQHGIFEAYYNTRRYSDVMALVNANLTNGAQYVEETYFWQGKVLAAQGDFQGARSAYSRALQHNPRYFAAQDALDELNA